MKCGTVHLDRLWPAWVTMIMLLMINVQVWWEQFRVPTAGWLAWTDEGDGVVILAPTERMANFMIEELGFANKPVKAMDRMLWFKFVPNTDGTFDQAGVGDIFETSIKELNNARH